MKKFSLAVLAAALVLGLALASCGGGGEEDPLNGTWTYGSSKYVFNNGKYIYSYSNVENHKGNYTTDGSTLTLEGTDVYLDSALAAMFGIDADSKRRLRSLRYL